MAILTSINIGQPQPLEGKKAPTGIFKQAVPRDTQINIGKQGIEGDAVLDRKHHGGVDQAVYLYFVDDYTWWSEQLERDLAPGLFGDNLTIGGVEGRQVAVGDRFVIDEVVLEVTSHRTPCLTFALRMGDKGWTRRFFKAERPGAYCRVIETGSLKIGEPVNYQKFAGDRITVSDLLAVESDRELDPQFMQRVLKTPVHYKMRADYEARLATLF